jgi:hypothetical protein
MPKNVLHAGGTSNQSHFGVIRSRLSFLSWVVMFGPLLGHLGMFHWFQRIVTTLRQRHKQSRKLFACFTDASIGTCPLMKRMQILGKWQNESPLFKDRYQSYMR